MNLAIPAELLWEHFQVNSLDELDPETRTKLVKQVVEQLWAHTGPTYDFLLHETQRKIMASIDATTSRKFFVLCSRRLGKSFGILAREFRKAMRKPGARILFLAPTKDNATEIVTELAPKLLEVTPDAYKPQYHAQTRTYEFPNGSMLRLRGVNGETYDNLRGGSADDVVCDELGFWDEPKKVIQSVAMPMTMTTRGRIICLTTPPEDLAHYSKELYEELALKGATVNFTIRDSPHVSDDVKAEYLLEAGEKPERVYEILAGRLDPETDTALREYFCRFVGDPNSMVVPEFAHVKSEIVREVPREDFANRFTVLDPGFVDLSAVLFSEDSFLTGKLLILDEWLERGASTPVIAQAIRERENKLWGPNPTNLSRVSDVEKRLIADLRQLHGLEFVQALKQDLQGAVNLVRTYIKSKQIIIHPRCTKLIAQLETASWTNNRKKFDNPGTNDLGHYDAVAALVYLVRKWDSRRRFNPYPDEFYARGGRFGIPTDKYVSPKRAHGPQKPNLYGDTPLGRRLHEQFRKKRS